MVLNARAYINIISDSDSCKDYDENETVQRAIEESLREMYVHININLIHITTLVIMMTTSLYQ